MCCAALSQAWEHWRHANKAVRAMQRVQPEGYLGAQLKMMKAQHLNEQPAACHLVLPHSVRPTVSALPLLSGHKCILKRILKCILKYILGGVGAIPIHCSSPSAS